MREWRLGEGISYVPSHIAAILSRQATSPTPRAGGRRRGMRGREEKPVLEGGLVSRGEMVEGGVRSFLWFKAQKLLAYPEHQLGGVSLFSALQLS